jgi:hypothetical protein
MKIFLLHESPILNARYYTDDMLKRGVTDVACLLSNAHRVIDGRPGKLRNANSKGLLYRYSRVLAEEEGRSPVIPLYAQVSYPWEDWVMASSANYTWVAAFYLALCREYSFRFQSAHGASRYLRRLQDLPSFFMTDEETPAPIDVPSDFIVARNNGEDVVNSYRWCFTSEMMRFAKWTKRTQPRWVQEWLTATTKEIGQKTGSETLTPF